MQQDWMDRLGGQFALPYFQELQAFVTAERAAQSVFPPEEDVFRAFDLTSFAETQVVLLGQDPYHGPGQAHGLCFSVPDGVRLPPSLRNIHKELSADLGVPAPASGDLTHWARQGVLMLNTTLTVRQGEAGSHQGRGWERFTDHVISLINEKSDHVVFILWGAHARSKKTLITNRIHNIVESAHPSPLSAHNGFLGSRPFSRVNEMRSMHSQPPISWV